MRRLLGTRKKAERIACDLLVGVTNPSWQAHRLREDPRRAAEILAPIKLAAFDLDGTLLQGASAWSQITATYPGMGKRATAIHRQFQLGRLSHREMCIRVAKLWEPPPHKFVIQHLCEGMQFRPGAVELLAALRNSGVTTAIISTGIETFVRHAAKALQVDRVYSNRMPFRSGKLDAEQLEIRVSPATKGIILDEIAQEIGCARNEVFYLGDTKDDVHAVKAAGVGALFDNVNKEKGHADLLIDDLQELHQAFREARVVS